MAVTLGPSTGSKSPAVTATKTKEVAFIVDKSGSMEACREQVISGFNEFVGDLQREADLSINFWATMFDTVIEHQVHGRPVKEVNPLTRESYVPGGCTALYDALGATLNKMEALLKDETQTPIVVVVMTDGHENSSREFNQQAIAARIKALQDKGNWTFVFMGAAQDAWAAAAPLGIAQANTMSYESKATGQSITSNSQATIAHLRSGDLQTRSFYQHEDEADKVT